MSSETGFEFTKENIDTILSAVAKEYRKLGGKLLPAEFVLIGGASVLINYGFRNSTTDLDAVIQSSSAMKDAIIRVGDKYGLPYEWLNDDFRKTSSYSPKLIEHSEYYRTFSSVLTVRTVKGVYLIAMKLRSGRQYKKDQSDVIGIINEMNSKGTPISLNQIIAAAEELYGSWEAIPAGSREFIKSVFENGDYQKMFKQTVEQELQTRKDLILFEKEYPGVLSTESLQSVIDSLKNRHS